MFHPLDLFCFGLLLIVIKIMLFLGSYSCRLFTEAENEMMSSKGIEKEAYCKSLGFIYKETGGNSDLTPGCPESCVCCQLSIVPGEDTFCFFAHNFRLSLFGRFSSLPWSGSKSLSRWTRNGIIGVQHWVTGVARVHH